jgi:DNA invertase Pin-like site-specific DNA recombinase
MRKIGYARVSSVGQNLDRQIAALRAEGCDNIYREKASGKDIRNQPQLEKAIDALATGDVLVVAEWDRATRSMLDGVAIIERIHRRGCLVKVLDKPHLDLTTPLGRGFIAFLSAMAEDERQRIVSRANDGRRAAKAKGVRFGRKPKLTAHQRAEARRRLDAGESARAIAKSRRSRRCANTLTNSAASMRSWLNGAAATRHGRCANLTWFTSPRLSQRSPMQSPCTRSVTSWAGIRTAPT